MSRLPEPLREHRHNLKEGHLEKSKLAQHAFEEGQRVNWDEARILEIESNSRYRKYKEDGRRTSFRNVVNLYVYILSGR
jgi:hypothetical protein